MQLSMPDAAPKPKDDVPSLIHIPQVAVTRGFYEVEGAIGQFMANVSSQLKDVYDQFKDGVWCDLSMTEDRAVLALRAIVASECETVLHFLEGLNDASLHPRHRYVRKVMLVHNGEIGSCGHVRYMACLIAMIEGIHTILMTDPALGSKSTTPHANWKHTYEQAHANMVNALR